MLTDIRALADHFLIALPNINSTMFTSGEFDEFAIIMGIKVLNSSPYYAQANGQAEASNKGIIKLIKRKIEENPRRWHTLLNEA